MVFLAVKYFDFLDKQMAIAFTSSGDDLNVFWVYDTSFSEHDIPPSI